MTDGPDKCHQVAVLAELPGEPDSNSMPPRPASGRPRAEPKPRADPPNRLGKEAKRRQGHEKSVQFGRFYIGYHEPLTASNPFWRALCPYHFDCTKSMQTNQEASEDDVLLRIKAWCLQAFEPSVTDRRSHMFLSRVPSLIEAGNSQSLSERLEASEKKNVSTRGPPCQPHGSCSCG